MTEFWKSNAKKFCEFCRVWFADNKASIDFHERGKRHQENVQKKIGALRKKGLKQYEEQQQKNDYLKQMEEDALRAFKKDAQKDQKLVSQYNQAAVEFKVRQFEEEAAAAKETTKSDAGGTWYEGKNEDGYSYYWNDVTGVSQWEQPSSFIPHQETSDTKTDASDGKEKSGEEGEEADEKGQSDDDTVKKEGDGDTEKVKSSQDKGQKRKADAYGQWTTVVNDESAPVDLQLPESAKNYISQYQPQVEQRQPEEEVEFGTKTISSIASSAGEKSNVGFKKRKLKGGGRSFRRREET